MAGIAAANGHIGLVDIVAVPDSDPPASPKPKREKPAADDTCPRWRALKLYIYEWARQHPDLDAISPLAWGVQERRGSWGI